MERADVIVAGGGIIGLATALQLLRSSPGMKVVILEKEDKLAQHQSGHNSGVIHTGIYYRPGSLKAKNCVQGVRQLLQFCEEKAIAYELCGKVVVATEPEELPRLKELERRGKENGVLGLRLIGPEQLREIEPHCKGIQALYSPNTGIIDYQAVCQAYAAEIKECGGEIHCGSPVQQVLSTLKGWLIQSDREEWEGSFFVNCCGLQADQVAELSGTKNEEQRIIPFRGEYYFLKPERKKLLKGLIYPVPDPAFPFLGVHLTRTIHGQVEAGPNAVLALAREGYTKGTINLSEAWNTFSYRGFWNLAAKYWRTGLYEVWRSLSKRAFLNSLRRYVPELCLGDLIPGGSGVRAQAVTAEGKLVDDFLLQEQDRRLDVLSAPSPGATGSLSIGKYLAQRVLHQLDLPMNGIVWPE